MSKNRDRINELVEYLNECSYAYYVLDEPIIDDAKYEKLYDELKLLEETENFVLYNSPTQRIGDVVLDKFEKSIHRVKMWSLDKVTSFDSLESWYNKNLDIANENNLSPPTYIVSKKFDGVSINLTYDDGKFVKGATRGNGEIGENVTEQVKTIKSIPLLIEDKSPFEIRGEIIMTKEEFENYNKTSETPLKNLRNGAAGALRNLDVQETRKRNLSSYLFDIGYFEGDKFSTYFECLEFLKKNKFRCMEFKLCTDVQQIKDEIKRIESLRNSLNYDIDGVVISINELEFRELLGYTVKFPKFSIAYKFEATEEITKLLDVEWNVGRSGRVSPTAILEPIDICGITIKRATLNNIGDIKRKNIKLNGEVLIRRSNDVIPEIIKGIGELDGLKEIDIPTSCPSCDSKLSQDGAYIYCPNTMSCKPQIVKSIVHFSSRDAMNIEGLSDKIATQFYENLNVKKISDLYTLTFEDLISLENFKDKKANNILNSINNSKSCNLANFIYALGIKNVGLKISKDIVKNYKTFDKIMNLTKEELDDVKGIGEIIIADILKFFGNQIVKDEIERLIKFGIKFKQEDDEKIVDNEFLDKTVVITGTMENFTRKELKDLLEKLGAKISDSVSKKTNYLISGSNSGSKLEKATSLGIEILTEEKFYEIVKKLGI